MSVRRLWLAFGIAWAVALVASAPATLLVSRADPPSGIEIGTVRGTVWNAQFGNVALHGLPIGDLRASLSLPGLLAGRVRIGVEGTTLAGDVLAGRRRGVEQMRADVVARSPAGLTGIDLAVDVRDLDVHLTGNTCAVARGAVTVEVRRADTGAALATLSGRPRCKADGARLELIAQPGLAGPLATLRIAIDLSHNGRVEVLSTATSDGNPVTEITLEQLGFKARGNEWVRLDRT